MHLREDAAGGQGSDPVRFLKQTQGGVLHQLLGGGAGVGRNLREPRFLLGCKVDFHAF